MSTDNDLKKISFDIQNLIEAIASVEGKEVQANIKPKPYKPKEPYALVFIASLMVVLIENKLSRTDILVLLGYAQLMEYGNHISISQKDVASITGLMQPNVARSLKKLKEIGLIYSTKEAPNSLYVNPRFIAKGDLKQFKKQLEGLEKMLPPEHLRNDNDDDIPF